MRIDFIKKNVSPGSSVLDMGSGGIGSCIPKNLQPAALFIKKSSKDYIGIEKSADKCKRNNDLGMRTINVSFENMGDVGQYDVVFAGLSIMCADDIIKVLTNVKLNLIQHIIKMEINNFLVNFGERQNER